MRNMTTSRLWNFIMGKKKTKKHHFFPDCLMSSSAENVENKNKKNNKKILVYVKYKWDLLLNRFWYVTFYTPKQLFFCVCVCVCYMRLLLFGFFVVFLCVCYNLNFANSYLQCIQWYYLMYLKEQASYTNTRITNSIIQIK